MLIFIVLSAACSRNNTGLELPSIIGDNMLLQQNADIKLWGKAGPGETVVVSAGWQAEGRTVAGDDGKWTVQLKTPAAGGPYDIIITGKKDADTITNVLIGEVWVCSGQSNMEMPLAGWPPRDTVMHSASAIASASYPEIRLFTVARKVSGEPLEECTGKWEVCSPATVGPFSAAGYFFGRKLHEDLKVPVGLIASSWGGTPAEAWISAGSLDEAGEFAEEIKGIRESIPLLQEYQKWLESHRQVVADAAGENQWKDLDFKDSEAPMPEFDDSQWQAMNLPALFETATGDFDGAIWFRKTVELPVEMAGRDLLLMLGPIDDMDRTYFNGELVGSHEISGVYQVPREYNVPGKLVREGINTIAVRVIDNQGGGGLWALPGVMKITAAGNPVPSVSLDGEWKFQPVAELSGNKFYIFDLSGNEYQKIQRPKAIGSSTPTSLFNGMISPLLNYTVKGAIWYQGESNVGRHVQYSKIFPLMIENWREAWGIKDFPFYFVQIAPYVYGGVDSTESAWLRESQEAALKLPGTGMVVTLDIATVMNIHPPFKKEVGERLANLALANDYGKDIVSQGPVFNSMKIEGRTVRVLFSNTGGGLTLGEGKPSEFEIAGRDGKYVKADARISGDEVLLTSQLIREPVSVRYCWRNGAAASLFGKSGLPANQFRSGE